MRCNIQIITLVLSCFVFSVTAGTEPNTVHQEKVVQDRIVDTQQDRILMSQAIDAGLSAEDVTRYKQIMEGPNGAYYRRGDANMFYVLGAEANTNEESMRYARLWVRSMDGYYTKLAKMIQMYSIASTEYYGENPIMFDILGRDVTSNGPFTDSIGKVGRVKLYINANGCSECDQLVKREIGKLESALIAGIDIFVVDSNGRDQVVQNWAKNQRIPLQLVRERLITLNHDDGNQKDKTMPFIEVSFVQ